MSDNADSKADDNAVQRPSQTFLSRKLLTKHIQKMHIQNGDVLAVKAGSAVAKQEILKGIADAMGRLGLKDIILIVVDRFDDLSILDEKEMGKHGWFRAPALQRLVHIPKDGDNGKGEKND